MNDLETLTRLIRERRSIFPKTYLSDAPIERAAIELVLENARWAPTHKLTEPWRFRVFHSEESRKQLSDFLAEYYRDNTPAELFSEEKMQKAQENPLRAGAVIALILHPEPIAKLPEFEEIASLAMAVQNMWLTCHAMGIGAYWSSPPSVLSAAARPLLQVAEGERCLGVFYMGRHEMPLLPGKRGPVEEKTLWM
jgi:nitroreductase